MRKFIALTGISIASFLTAIDFAIVNTALPTIQHQLHASLSQLQWVMNIYVLLICATMVTMGRFGDLFGRKKVLIIGTIIFAAGSLFAGLSSHLTLLIISRALQGLGSAIIIPCSLALITDIFPAEERAKAIGIWSGINGIGFAIGPVLGGVLVSLFNWPWVFYIVLPFAIITIIICSLFLNKTQQAQPKTKIDWLGFSLLATGISTFVIAMIQGESWGWSSMMTLTILAISIISLTMLIFIEKRVAQPIINFKLFANHRFFTGVIANTAVVTFAYAGFFLIPLYCQSIRHDGAGTIGLLLLSITAAMTIFSPITGRLVNRIGAGKTILVGLTTLCLSILMQCNFNSHTSIGYLSFSFLLFGSAWGILFGSATNFSISALPEKSSGIASGMLWTIQNIGGAVGLAIAGAIFRVGEKHSFISGYQDAMWFLFGVTLLALLGATILLKNNPKHHALPI